MAFVYTDPESKQWKVTVNEDTLAQLAHEGRSLSKDRPRLTKFALMLSHPEFAEFFDQNFQTWEDCETSIMLLKMGTKMREMIWQSSGEEVSGHQLLAAMVQVINNSETRQYMVARLRDFMQSGSSSTSEVRATAPLEMVTSSPPRNAPESHELHCRQLGDRE